MSELPVDNRNLTTKPYYDEANYAPVLASFILVLLIISVGANFLVTAAFVRYPKLRTNFNYYLLNLAMSDILLALCAMSNFALFLFCGYYPLGTHGCTFWIYTEWLFSASTENTMMLVSVDRMVSVYFPIWYRGQQSSKYSAIALGIMWIWLNVLILPVLYLARLQGQPLVSGLCLIDYSVYRHVITTCVVLVFWLPETVTVISYVLIAVKVRRKFNASSAKTEHPADLNGETKRFNAPEAMKLEAFEVEGVSQQESAADNCSLTKSPGRSRSILNGATSPRIARKSRDVKEKKTFQLLSSLVVAVLLCCVPADVYHFLAATQPEYASFTFYKIANFVTFVFCLLNPVLYHKGSDDMKKAIKSLLVNPFTPAR